jgi:pyridoxamine 5'-phosphate oxidase
MTNPISLPAYYNDLEGSFAEAWTLLEAGVTHRHSPAHMPTVGTVDEDGAPQLRIMVLREVSRDSRTLRFHTDARSDKATQLKHSTATSILIYDHAAKAQIRLSGHASVVSEGGVADGAWLGSTPFARRCYMAEAAPGTTIAQPSSGLPEWIEGKQPEEQQLADYRGNFAAVMFEANSIEWLYLANPGHRRARWHWDQAQNLWLGSWLVP